MSTKQKEVIRKEAREEEINELKDSKIKDGMSASEKKIIALLDFAHLEELLYLLDFLEPKEIELFLEHYKKLNPDEAKDKKISMLVRNSKNPRNLVDNVRNELINSIKDEISALNERISHLRKKGTDTYVEEMKLYPAVLKIKIFGATSKKDDFYKIKKIIASVEEMVKEKEEKVQKERETQEKKKEEIQKEEKKNDKLEAEPEKDKVNKEEKQK